MLKSRCGLLCSECEYREKMGCAGCVNIEQPFWGDCSVKSCCEGRNHEHCGHCSEIPCDVLTAFAYDKEQGDDGVRIKNCQTWAETA